MDSLKAFLRRLRTEESGIRQFHVRFLLAVSDPVSVVGYLAARVPLVSLLNIKHPVSQAATQKRFFPINQSMETLYDESINQSKETLCDQSINQRRHCVMDQSINEDIIWWINQSMETLYDEEMNQSEMVIWKNRDVGFKSLL